MQLVSCVSTSKAAVFNFAAICARLSGGFANAIKELIKFETVDTFALFFLTGFAAFN